MTWISSKERCDCTFRYIDASAPNAEAIKNGRGLVLKGKFVKLHKAGDFIRPDQPTHRCLELPLLLRLHST
ncbi:MAG: hypothetical protein O3C21_11780 [Verrucomicrobia bacterium]|nr:hypothetical protein [Verrucomicrobiota bacterium]